MSNHVSVHVRANQEVYRHCDLLDGGVALRVGAEWPTAVYLFGSPEELRELGLRIAAAAESLTGEAVA